MSPQIFVSYAHVDNDFIPELKERLGEYFDIWIDTSNLAAGKNWRDEIDKAIKESFAVIVIITPESCVSRYVTYEWSFALGLGIPVIPLLLKKADEIHPRLDALQYFDFSKRFKEPWKELIDRLRATQDDTPSAGATEVALRLLQLAKEQYEHNDLNNALDTLDEALRLAHTKLLDDIHYELARVYLKLRDLDKAEHHLKRALELKATHVRALVASGDLYRMRANNATDAKTRTRWLTESEAKFRAALDERDELLDEAGESVWASLGGILRRKNEIDAAITAYKKAAKIKRGSYPYTNLGTLYIQKNDLPHTREMFGLVELFAQAKVNLNAGDEWAHNDLFTAQVIFNRLDEARRSLTRIKVVAPANAIESLRSTLGSLLQVEGLPSETSTFINEADQELAAHLEYLTAEG